MRNWNNPLYEHLKCVLGNKVIFLYLENQVMIKQLDQKIIQI